MKRAELLTAVHDLTGHLEGVGVAVFEGEQRQARKLLLNDESPASLAAALRDLAAFLEEHGK